MSYGKIEYDPIRDAYRCEICQKWFAALGNHIWQIHGLTSAEYKTQFGLEQNKSLCVKRISDEKRKHAIESNAAQNLTMAGWLKKTKGKTTIQNYKRCAETARRLDELHTHRKFEKRRKRKRSTPNSVNVN